MLYVKEANTRSQKKKEKVEKENKVKKRGCGKAQGGRKKKQQKMKIILKCYPLDRIRKITRFTFLGHMTEYVEAY